MGSTLFSDAMALRQVEHSGRTGIYDAELNEHWTVGPKLHGGVMMALCAAAARTAHGTARSANTANTGSMQPIAVSTSYLSAPAPGRLRVHTFVRKPGRRVSVVDVELVENDRAAVHAVVTLGEPEHHVPPLLTVNPAVALMAPEPPPDIDPIGPDHPMAGTFNYAEGCDIRPLMSSVRTESTPAGKPPVIQIWVRPRGMAPDILFALMCGDISMPVTFAVGRTGWAPTV
ncbi:acyl-CoA thioesterase domain-containing protein, partial [Mycobacterium sp.]|uniref:acyl-CoA thioesterase domain-containing protein n=1 Tax=Mycobacterium sp. TaxID=1785 RepID=UPI002D35C981